MTLTYWLLCACFLLLTWAVTATAMSFMHYRRWRSVRDQYIRDMNPEYTFTEGEPQ